MRIRSYEFRQEINHTMHETRGWGTYPLVSHNEEYYHAPPPPTHNMHKMLNHTTTPSTFHYELSDDEDNHHHQVVVHDDRGRFHHDGNHSQYRAHHHGTLLRPPLGYVGRYQSHQNRPHMVVDQEVKSQNGYVSQHGPQKVDQQVENQNGYAIASQHQNQHGPQMTLYRDREGSRFINNNNNHNLEDYSKRYPSYYYDEVKHNDYYDHGRIIEDDYMESLIKGINGLGKGMVKKIEVIEYERTTYRGGHQEWKVLSNGYPKSGAQSVKGF